MQSASPVLQESDCAQLRCRRSNIGRQSMGQRSQDIDPAVRKHFAASLGTYVAKRAVAHIRFGATDAPPIILCRGLLEGDS
jgi:hypothetical protein